MALSSPAIRSFADQPAHSVSASSLASLVTALKDTSIASELTNNAANASLLTELLQRLLSVSNDGAKNTAVRVMSLECFFLLSKEANDTVRQGTLFGFVSQLNASFDEMLEREGDSLSSQREMLTVVLLRCTGYVRMRAGDVLAQLCRGDDRVLINLLLSMLANNEYEWALVQSVMRWLYELTTPACYFSDNTSTTTQVQTFQAKIELLIDHCLQGHVLAKVLAELTKRWSTASATTLHSAATAEVLTSSQHNEILCWAIVLRHAFAWLDNLSEYCDKPDKVKALQRSLLGESEGFFSAVVIPFVMTGTNAWEKEGRLAPESLRRDATGDPLLGAVLSCLKLLRFALYKPVSALGTPVVTALQSLTQYTMHMVPVLRHNYAGLLLMLYVTECLCNVNAKTIRTPVDLGTAFELLVNSIASDKKPLVAGGPVTAAQAFAISFHKEESNYAETHNESVQLVHDKFAAEEAEIREDAEAFEAIVALEEQLEYLQAIIMRVALTQLLVELAQAGVNCDEPPRAAVTAPPPPQQAPKKKKLPAKYCCQLTGKLMREPVTLANGHHFELDALQKIIDQMGHVDPITGESFDGEVEVDVALQQEIAAFRVSKGASSSS